MQESKICLRSPFSRHPFTPSMPSPENSKNPQIWYISLSLKYTKSRKIIRPWWKSHQFWRWSWYTRMPNFRPFLPCLLKMLETLISLIFSAKSNNFWRWSGYISMPHFRSFLPCIFLWMPWNPNFTQFLATRGLKLAQYWPKSKHFWRWSGYISMPHFRSFLQCILTLECLKNPNFTTFWCHQRAKTHPVLAKIE